jgi:hypothetical protein
LEAVIAPTELPIITPNNEALQNSKGKRLSPDLYQSILTHVNMLWPNAPFRSHDDLPHPPNAHVLPTFAVPITHITHKGRNYSTFSMHSGDSSISYTCRDGTIDAGFIVSMWTQVLRAKSCLFIIVVPHAPLTANDAAHSPYMSRPGFMGTVVYSQPIPMQERQHVLIEQMQIRGHIAYYDHPPGTFGIKVGVRVLIDSLCCDRE